MSRFWNIIHSFKRNWVFLLIFILGVFFRLYRLGEVPAGYSPDEIAILYDAWGIARTGYDQWNHFLPVHFISFGDYKSPGLIYILAMLFTFLEVNDVVIRYVVAVFGIVLLPVTYLISRRLWPLHKHIALISTAFISLSPWHIHLSRIGYEATVATTFIALAVVCFLYKERGSILFFFYFIFLGFAFYTYHSPKIIILPLLLLTYFFDPHRIKRNWLSGMIILFILLIPFFLTASDSSMRATQTLSLSPQALISQLVSHFSLSYWLVGSNNITHSVPGFGILSLPEIVFFTASIWGLYRTKNKQFFWIILIVLIALIPSFLSRESPHALRMILILPWVQLLSAWGLVYAFGKKAPIFLVIGLFLIVSTAWFGVSYFSTYARTSALFYQYGYKEAMKLAYTYSKQKQTIIISSRLTQPYIYYTFYTGILPKDFAAGALANVRIEPISEVLSHPNAVYVATADEISSKHPSVENVILNPENGDPVLIIATTGN